MSTLLRTMRATRLLRQPVAGGYSPSLLRSFVRTYAQFPPHTVIDMPALSPTMEHGNVGAWSKKVGDSLSPGDVLVEIETDKATMDFEFQDEGYLAQILVPEGTKDVNIGQPIGVFVENADDVPAFKDFTLADVDSKPVAATPKEEASEKNTAPKEGAAEKDSKPAAEKSTSEPPKTESAPAGRIFASPIAKMIALDKGIKLSDIKGTGPNGRVIKRDVENYKPPAPAASPAASPAAKAPAAAAAANASSGYKDTPISQMRKVIAQRLTASKQTNPDYIVSSTVSVSKLLALRKSLNDASNGEYKLSVNDILLKAVALANKKVPAANSSWLEAEGVIREYEHVDVSVAVSTPSGLITPVIRKADSIGLAQISSMTKDLAKRARDNKLKPDEFQGGTVTISNMGMNHAVSMFTAIINPPQSVILAVGTVERRAVEDPAAEFGFVFDDVMTLTGSFDHKVIDGAVGAEWMRELKTLVENPLKLLL